MAGSINLRNSSRSMPSKKRPDIYGVVAEFDTPEAVLAAARQVRAAGYRRAEAYTPFAIQGLSEALGFEKTGVPIVVLTCGVFGALAGFFMLWYANVISYPWNVGGRPPNSWPAFIPITFELECWEQASRRWLRCWPSIACQCCTTRYSTWIDLSLPAGTASSSALNPPTNDSSAMLFAPSLKPSARFL